MQIELFGTIQQIDESSVTEAPEVIQTQIAAYESGQRLDFDLEIDFPSTFTGTVMQAVAEIPAGETRTYGEIAPTLETAPIAVGQACSNNPLPIIVPCHRIVGADSLTGYVGGLELKRQLLEHEGASIPGNS